MTFVTGEIADATINEQVVGYITLFSVKQLLYKGTGSQDRIKVFYCK